MNLPIVAVGLVVYLLASRLVMRLLGGGLREAAMAWLNLAGLYLAFFRSLNTPVHAHFGVLLFIEYFGLVVFQYVTLRVFSGSDKPWLHWLAFFCPITFLILIRDLPYPAWEAGLRRIGALTGCYLVVPYVVGISYQAFRCSRLVLEVRNGSVKMPGIWEYLCFAFFLPAMAVGPINTYAHHRRGFEAPPWDVPIGRAALRVLVGLVKYEFLGGIFNQLTYSGFLLNGRPHHWADLPVAMVFYYLFLYCNFSGVCDVAIGAAGLIGIPVLENFANPFAARNVRDFWNRWHITLSVWMRDVVFSPLSKALVHRLGVRRADHAIALAIMVVFLLVGLWHGFDWNFAAFGAAHGFGVVASHYYTIFLKKRLGRDGFKAYQANPWIRAAAVTLTFCFCAASLFLFANTFPQMAEILAMLR